MAQQQATSSLAPWQPQQQYIQGGWKAAKNLFDVGMPGYYPQATVAGFDPVQQQAQQQSLDYIGGSQVQDQLANAQAAQQRMLSGQVPQGPGTPFGQITDALTQGVQQNLSQNILPTLRSGMIRSGQQGGGTRGDLVQNRAISDAVTQGMTQPLANMYGNAWNQAQGLQMDALRQAPTTLGAPLNMFGAMNAVGGARRNLSQAQIDADRARYEYEAMSPYQNLAQYQGATGGSWGGEGTGTYPKQSKWPSIIGAIAGIGLNKFG